MRLLGIDYGTKRVGLALSNEDGNMAFPLKTLEQSKELNNEIKEIIEAEGVEMVVLGASKNLDGSNNPLQSDIEKFAATLKGECGVETVFEPEYLSTQESLHIQGRTKETDASAATIILNSYIMKSQI